MRIDIWTKNNYYNCHQELHNDSYEEIHCLKFSRIGEYKYPFYAINFDNYYYITGNPPLTHFYARKDKYKDLLDFLIKQIDEYDKVTTIKKADE